MLYERGKSLKLISTIRFCDLLISFIVLIIFSPIIIFTFLICFLETKNPIFVQKRVGKYNKPFNLFKFRTMYLDTPSLASHLVNKKSVTKFGRFIRLTKIDELPQLFNVIKGEMSLVGPRPCLLNQKELILYRNKYRIFNVLPGITGLAQIKGVDMSDPEKLSKLDNRMIFNLNLLNYFKYLFLTLYGKGRGDKINNK